LKLLILRFDSVKSRGSGGSFPIGAKCLKTYCHVGNAKILKIEKIMWSSPGKLNIEVNGLLHDKETE